MMATAQYAQSVRRLSHVSVHNGHDAFQDVPWPGPDEPALDPEDPRFALASSHPLAATAWYRSLSVPQQARFGLELTTQTLKYGISFESVLSQGLIEFARAQPNRSPEYRYALHELIEESQHSLMFQEFIDRSGTDPQPFGGFDAWLDRRVPWLGHGFPELLMSLVLAGEIFVDQDNRKMLRTADLHPLLRRIIQIHVTEEARHLCFARRLLEQRLPTLSPVRREIIAWVLPFSLADSAKKMLQPAPCLVTRFAIPPATLAEAFGPGSAHRAEIADVVEPVRALAAAHGMFRPRHERHWRRRGLLRSPRAGYSGS
ncbi:MAG: diiron oxygenase [Myxococcota bacterium]